MSFAPRSVLERRQQLVDRMNELHRELGHTRNELKALAREFSVESHMTHVVGGVECSMVALYVLAERADGWQL